MIIKIYLLRLSYLHAVNKINTPLLLICSFSYRPSFCTESPWGQVLTIDTMAEFHGPKSRLNTPQLECVKSRLDPIGFKQIYIYLDKKKHNSDYPRKNSLLAIKATFAALLISPLARLHLYQGIQLRYLDYVSLTVLHS